MPIRPIDIMTKAEYDPDKDVKIALAQIADAACSETEADSKITAHTGSASAHHAKTTKASEITSEHFALARMPDLALDKVMVGQGAGSDPVAEDKPSQLSFTELWSSQEHDAGSSWTDWDLSSIIPAGVAAVLVLMFNTYSGGSSYVGVRKNGSALVAYEDLAPDSSAFRIVEPDANRIIEYKEGTSGYNYYRIVGYWA